MKHPLKTLGVAAVLTGTMLAGTLASMPAHANNSHVEMALQNYGDLSMFYQGLVNSGVLASLREDEHYTIFAPVNNAFLDVQPKTYPCFYAAQCRPQIATLLRDHIVTGQHDLKDLTSYGSGISTLGPRVAHVEQPYLGEYTMDGHRILSRADIDGVTIYRISGLGAGRDDLAAFTRVSAVEPEQETVTQRTTTYTTSYPDRLYPAGTMAPGANADTTTRTTVTSYSTDQ